MSIFEIPAESGNEAEAKRQLEAVNRYFAATKVAAKNDFYCFWLEENDPIGVLQAMGPNAYMFLAIAYARVQMLVAIANLIGQPELVDESSLLPPYTLVFNQDGSLLSATPK